MGGEQSLTSQQRAEYDDMYEDSCLRAAVAISDADIMLFAHGAGMSADSGLPVFNDIAKFEAYLKMKLTYMDICSPEWLHNDPEIFFGFWGKCYNEYMAVTPNTGYFIVKKWKDQFFLLKNQIKMKSG